MLALGPAPLGPTGRPGPAGFCDTDRMARPIDGHRLLIDGYEPLKKARRVFRSLPSDPRCKLCQNPFGGVDGTLFGVIGHKPSLLASSPCCLASRR